MNVYHEGDGSGACVPGTYMGDLGVILAPGTLVVTSKLKRKSIVLIQKLDLVSKPCA